MSAHGIRLHGGGRDSLKGGIPALGVPEGFPEPKPFPAPGKDAGPSEILRAARAAGISDEFDGAPLAPRLKRLAERKTELLAACCFDDDPFFSSARAVLREDAGKVADGLRLAARACGARETVLAAASRRELKALRDLPPGLAAAAAESRYPARILLMRRLCGGKKRGAWIGAQACAALSDAVRRGRPQTETVVTAAGDGVAYTRNFRVRIGTPVGAVLKAAGARENVRLVAVGSSLAGRTVTDLSLPVTAATRGVLALTELPARRVFPCVRCGRCARACPQGILPWLALRELESGAPDPLRLFHVESCVGCAACDAVCPSGIGLVAAVRRAAARKEAGFPDETA